MNAGVDAVLVKVPADAQPFRFGRGFPDLAWIG